MVYVLVSCLVHPIRDLTTQIKVKLLEPTRAREHPTLRTEPTVQERPMAVSMNTDQSKPTTHSYERTSDLKDGIHCAKETYGGLNE